jgi:signal transduction histidine kinase
VAVKTFLDLAPAKMAEEKMDITGLRNPDFWKEYYTNVQGQIEKINNLLKDLWTASEKPTFDFTDEIKARDAVDAAIEGLRPNFEAKNISIENQIPENLPLLKVDKPKFFRLFDLLLKDELASLPNGSHVKVTAQEIAGGPSRNSVQIQVTDNGPGLPQEALRLVFDPFVVRSDSPMEYGIHLMACFFIVHHHGGRIEARSDNGRGTTFTIRLPLDPNLAQPAKTDTEFLQKVLLNDSIWEKLLRSE